MRPDRHFSEVQPTTPDNGPEKGGATERAAQALSLLQGIGSLLTGLMGLAFILLACYLFYTEYRSAEGFRLKFLMMPMMNLLISSMLLFYCKLLFSKTKATRRAMRNGTFSPPKILVTRYDIIAILAFILVVAAASYLLIR